MFHRPLITDAQPVKHTYKAGDRILVRVSCTLTAAQYHKIARAVKKYTREDVNVLIVDCRYVQILWKHNQFFSVETICGPGDIEHNSIDVGVANLNCSVTELLMGDTLVVIIPEVAPDTYRNRVKSQVQRWAGQDVEVIIKEGQ